MSLLCFLSWSLSHIMWRAVSSEAAGGSSSSGSGVDGVSDTGSLGGTPAWVWVDVGIAWAIAPVAGGSLQLSLWRSIVPSWLFLTGALAFGLRAEEVRVGEVNRKGRHGKLFEISCQQRVWGFGRCTTRALVN